MIVGRAGVVHRPKEIIDAVAVEDIGGLAIGVVAKGTAFGGEDNDACGVNGNHVVIEPGAGHVSVAPVEIALSADGVGEHISVNLLSPSHG